ncbi:hypothetical protein ACMFMG_009898 [Clarireedia jacksonii]
MDAPVCLLVLAPPPLSAPQTVTKHPPQTQTPNTNFLPPTITESNISKEKHNQLPFIADVPEDRGATEEEIDSEEGVTLRMDGVLYQFDGWGSAWRRGKIGGGGVEEVETYG